VVFVLKGHTDTVDAVAVSPDGKLIATAASTDGETVGRRDGQGDPHLRWREGHTGQVLSVAFSRRATNSPPAGPTTGARVGRAGELRREELRDCRGRNEVAVAADGKTFAVAAGDVVKVFPQGEEKGAIELKGRRSRAWRSARTGR